MVTIGLPVYNGERWLKEALDSVLSQTYVDWELIVVDDGSSEERIMKIVECVKCRDERIRVIQDGKHLGIAARLNQMVAMARGELFARMDADDIMLPERLEKQVKFFDDNESANVVSCSAIVIDENGKKLGVRNVALIHPTVMGRTLWFKQNPYNEAYSGVEDYELWLRVKNKVMIHHISEPLMLYRERTHYNVQKVWRDRILGIKMIWSERYLFSSTWRALLQIANNLAVMVFIPIIHFLNLDKVFILRRNS